MLKNCINLSQRDDERYPITVVPEGQVFTYEEKISYPSLASSSISQDSALNTLVGLPWDSYRTVTFSEAQLPVRAEKQPWWKKRTILLLLLLILLLIGSIIGGIVYATSRRGGGGKIGSEFNSATLTGNSTKDSVTSSGLFLKDTTTWNMQTYWQDSYGNIKFQMSLDGKRFESLSNMTLTIPVKIGSPLSATASTDTTGVVYVSLSLS